MYQALQVFSSVAGNEETGKVGKVLSFSMAGEGGGAGVVESSEALLTFFETLNINNNTKMTT